MWHELKPTDLSYLDRSPHRLETELLVFAPAERVFDVLSGEGFEEWLEPLVEWRWTSAPPHGAGSTREVILDFVSVKERFLVWERGRRLTFAIEAMTLPLVRHMAEDMQLERRGEARTLLRYTVHYTPSLLMRAVHPAARVVFGKMFKDAARKVAMVAARAGARAASDRAAAHA